MKDKAVSSLMLALLFIGMLTLAFDVQPVRATLYIGTDYAFTGNIYDEIVVTGDNIVIDGGGYTLQGTGSGTGIDLTDRSNVTVKNTEITAFAYGIHLERSSGNIISENNIMNNTAGIRLSYSSGNIISRNILANNLGRGISVYSSSNNTLSGNNIKNNTRGILLSWSNYNSIIGNNVTANSDYGIHLQLTSAENMIYHNKFANNVNVLILDTDPASYWDNGYPSGGNYWSDYTGVDVKSGPNQDQPASDGIGDTQYIIDDDFSTRDHYPLMKPYGGSCDIGIINITITKTVVGQGYNLNVNFKTINYGINTETCNITAYANTTLIAAPANITLPSRNSTTILFTWNTTNVAKGNYTISADITQVAGETDTSDNTYTDWWIFVTIVGDVDGDRDVDVGDQRKVQLAMFTVPGDPDWDPNMDIDGDLDVDVGDQRKQQLHMFESW